jgi:glutamate-1-semialdehyde 2,1-aminomutase
MRIYQREKVVERLWHQGERLRDGLRQVIDAHGLADHFQVLGLPCNLVYAARDEQRQPSQPYRTLFIQEMIKRGFIMPSMVVSFSHSDEDIDRTVEAAGEALGVYRRALEDGIGKHLVGRPVKPVMRQRN